MNWDAALVQTRSLFSRLGRGGGRAKQKARQKNLPALAKGSKYSICRNPQALVIIRGLPSCGLFHRLSSKPGRARRGDLAAVGDRGQR